MFVCLFRPAFRLYLGFRVVSTERLGLFRTEGLFRLSVQGSFRVQGLLRLGV